MHLLCGLVLKEILSTGQSTQTLQRTVYIHASRILIELRQTTVEKLVFQTEHVKKLSTHAVSTNVFDFLKKLSKF